ncbi:hypothetical protein HAX54_025222 [Datura stramonium]|uniref:Uncharacterized protein n=1 Tax=Datura stramonium TaxID=4076 RepID=A0ABS8S6D7_DATST|nr:hypothetical protein [Datura stramonium]
MEGVNVNPFNVYTILLGIFKSTYRIEIMGEVFAEDDLYTKDDAYLGRYWTIACFSIIYVIGMTLLTMSAFVPGLKPSCSGEDVCHPKEVQTAVCFVALYLIALGTGGIKPCVSSYGADQFDDADEVEKKQKLYRNQKPGGSPLTRISQVLVASFRKFDVNVPEDKSLLYETTDAESAIMGSRKLNHTKDLGFFHKAAVQIESDHKERQYRLVETVHCDPSCAKSHTIGQLEFFYEQAPDAMRSLCSALSLTTVALGNYLSSMLVTIVMKITTKNGKPGWIPDNLNYGHIDYFYYLAVLSVLNLGVYLCDWVKWYTYKRPVGTLR